MYQPCKHDQSTCLDREDYYNGLFVAGEQPVVIVLFAH